MTPRLFTHNGRTELVWTEDDVMTALERGTLALYPMTQDYAPKGKPEPLVQSNGHPVQSEVKTVKTLF